MDCAWGAGVGRAGGIGGAGRVWGDSSGVGPAGGRRAAAPLAMQALPFPLRGACAPDFRPPPKALCTGTGKTCSSSRNLLEGFFSRMIIVEAGAVV